MPSSPLFLKDNAHYYASSQAVTKLLNSIYELNESCRNKFIENNLQEIRNEYSWESLIDKHEKYFYWLLSQKQ